MRRTLPPLPMPRDFKVHFCHFYWDFYFVAQIILLNKCATQVICRRWFQTKPSMEKRG